jgi:TrmH family RNA methyltransferase
VVEEALAAGRLAFVAWCREASDEAGLRSILRAAEAAKVPVHELAPRAFAATADTVTPTGLLGAAGLRWLGLAELEVPDRAKWLVLCDVRDPGNAGTMIRSADAFGVSAVISLGHCVDLYEPKVVRATAGAVFHLPLARCEWPELRAWAADKGIATVATDLGGKVSLPGLTWAARTAILIGNEAHGLPEDVLTQADVRVKIPMSGRAESLNAAVAAGVMLYAASAPLRDTHKKDKQPNTEGLDGEK